MSTKSGRWRACLIALVFLAACPAARAQHQRDVEQWTTETKTPDGVPFQAPIPLDMLRENTVGTDGGGLCVGTSVANDLTYLGRREIGDALLAYLRTRPGGSIPSQLDRDLNTIRQRFPELRWIQYEGDDFGFAETTLKAGRPVFNTYGTGRPYLMRVIYHMVNTVHLDRSWGVIADNNAIYRGQGADARGFTYVCLPRPEYERRTTMNGGWFGTIQSGTVPGTLGLPAGSLLPLALFLALALASSGTLLAGTAVGAWLIVRS